MVPGCVPFKIVSDSPTLHSRWLLFFKVMIISLWNLLQYHSIVRWAIQAQWAEPLVLITATFAHLRCQVVTIGYWKKCSFIVKMIVLFSHRKKVPSFVNENRFVLWGTDKKHLNDIILHFCFKLWVFIHTVHLP